MTNNAEANAPSKVIRNDGFISLLLTMPCRNLVADAMHSATRLDDSVADLRAHVEAERTRVVAVIQKQRDLVGVEIFQILSGRLEVDVPRAAGVGRGRERDDLGSYRARRFEREIGSISRTANMMNDVARDRVRKDKSGDKAATALKKRDVKPSRDEVIGAAFTSALTLVGDIETHVENISIRSRIVNDLDGGCVKYD